jgi:uncharacterized protein YraI
MVSSLGFVTPSAAQESEGTVTAQELVTMEVAEDLNLRDEPSANGEVLAVMPAGSTVEVEAGAEPENEYLPVTFEDQEGWAFIAYLVPEGGDNTATVLEDLNLRDAPNTDGAVVMVMPAGAEVRVFGSAEDDAGAAWSRVEYEDVFGWAATEFIGDGTDDDGGDDGDDGNDPGTPDQPAMTTDDLNLRAGPSLDDEVLLIMPAGAEILIGDQNVDGFVPTSYGGEIGWAYFEFIAVVDGDDGDDGGDAPTGEERIALDDLNLRAGPSTTEAILDVIPAGGSMTLTGEGAANGFVTVVYEGVSGWVAAEFIAQPDELEAAETPDDSGDDGEAGGEVDEELAGQTRLTLDDLNLREGPSTDDAVILVIPAGETVTLTGVGYENGFITVEYGETTGWVAAEFLGE